MNLSSQLENVSKLQPQNDAIIWHSGSISFAKFFNMASCIGSALVKKFKLKKGENVALVMENNYFFLPVLFGIWQAGLTAVPVNSKLHKKELSWIFENSDAKLIFCSKKTAPNIHSNVPIIESGSKEFEFVSTFENYECFESSIMDPAWIFYTSGTTGKPKGAVLTHRNLLAMSLSYYADVDSVGKSDMRIHAAPMSHGSGIYSIPFILKGAKNFICDSTFDPEEIFELLNSRKNISFFGAPTMIKRLTSHSMAEAEHKSLKTLEFGGAPMHLPDTKTSLTVFGKALYQLYGQGEAPMTITNITKDMYADNKKCYYENLLSSAGIARTGVLIKIVDSNWKELPIGQVGEIVTKSECVMKEYYKNPKETAKSLNNGWLLTGDLGSIDKHGILTIKDRSKDMIITGGMNVYPREIEDIILLHPLVEEVAVIGIEDKEWGEIVVAIVALKRSGVKIQDSLDTLCLENLARFKRPKRYFFKDELPKNNYGKIVKTGLRLEFTPKNI